MTKRNYTLIELLTVIFIIAVLAGLVIPGMAMVRVRAKRLNCASNLKQVTALGMQFSNDRDGQLPLYKAASAYTVRSKNVESYYRKAGQTRFEAAKDATEAITGDNQKLWTAGLLRYAKYDMSVFFCPADERELNLFKASDDRSSYSLNYGDAERPGGASGATAFIKMTQVTRSPAGVVYFGETDLGNLGMKSTDTFAKFFNNSKALSRKPHSNEYNTSFLDGHVDSLRQSAVGDLYDKNNFKIK